MKRQSQNAQTLELLSGGQWVGHHRLYEIGCVAHSRIAELRSRGYVIEQRRVTIAGRPAWEYRLAGSRRGEDARGSTPTAADVAPLSGATSASLGHLHADSQLSLLDAA